MCWGIDMSKNVVRLSLFDLIKKAMKVKGHTYAWLAKQLDVSEISVKRLFKDKDCKTSRLLDICEVLDLDLADLLAMQKRARQAPQYLPLELELALGEDRSLFVLFILLISQLSLPDIRSHSQMDEATFYLKLRRLEKLGLIELLDNERFRFCVSLPIQWRLDGALASAIKQANLNYLAHCFDHEAEPDYQFFTLSRLMTEASIQEIKDELDRVKQRFDYLAFQDQLFYKIEELNLYKLVSAAGTFPVTDMFPLTNTSK